jgi:hypothetical protein
LSTDVADVQQSPVLVLIVAVISIDSAFPHNRYDRNLAPRKAATTVMIPATSTGSDVQVEKRRA